MHKYCLSVSLNCFLIIMKKWDSFNCLHLFFKKKTSIAFVIRIALEKCIRKFFEMQKEFLYIKESHSRESYIFLSCVYFNFIDWCLLVSTISMTVRHPCHHYCIKQRVDTDASTTITQSRKFKSEKNSLFF